VSPASEKLAGELRFLECEFEAERL